MVPALRIASLAAPSRARDHVAHAVPGQPRAQLGELVGGVAAAEQIEHALEGRAAQPAKGRGVADQLEERIDADFGRHAEFARVPAGVRRAPAASCSLSLFPVPCFPTAGAPRSPPVAAPAHPADCAGSASTRCAPRAWRGSPRRRPPGRRDTWERESPRSPHPHGGRRARCAASRWPPRAALRSGSPGPRRPCRCPTPASKWRRARVSSPPSTALR